ncbi:MarR family winged helix-turn-helix transcriptional regulator [Sporomusa malonica]|uniref:DNA-binding transcriptional regulator, MarR family n=1 Tax=Sporomusa malonica TaxID=112901 RepID=A0A1W1YG44_9FIRM|nr:MarR family winged helix-turn-helix transcriptional regulator [Sporomusa malonica]SMC35123.1 DNA-binding transcriptional regulator, MarR family [Sporomusa malonica]
MQKDRFGKHISLIYRYSQIFFNSELKKYNLGSGQYIFLISLFKNNGISQEQLSDIVKIDKATTARAVAKLVNENYVIRKISENDKRAYNLYATDKAESIKNILFGILDSWNEIMLENIDRKERETLLKLIEKVGSNILSKTNQFEQNTK